MKRINLFYLCTAFVAILGLYASCSSSGSTSTDKEPPEVEHNIAVTDGGSSLTLTVIATDPSGIESYTTPRLELGLVNPDGTTKYIRVPLRPVSDAESTWMYNITNDDIGKKVRYRNISATDTVYNKSNLDENLDTGVLAGLGHKMTVLDSNGIETPNQTIANKGDTIKLTIMAATFENTSYTYAASIKIAENIIATDPHTPTDLLNEFTYTIKEGEVGAITYTASVTPTARDEVSIATDHPSRIVVPDQIMPEFTTPTLTASTNPAKVDDTLTLTVTARDAGGLASATATVRVGDSWTFPIETIEVPSEDGVTTDFSFVFVNTVGVRTRSGDVSYSVSVTDIAGNTTSPNWVTSTGISVNPDAILTHSIVGLDPTVADAHKTAVKEGDIIRLRTNVAESITEPVTFTASLKIDGTPKSFSLPTIDSDGWTVFEYTVGASQNGAVTYSLEATAAGAVVGESFSDRVSGITVDTIVPTVSSVALSKITGTAYAPYAKAGDVIQLEIDSGTDTGTPLTYVATLTIGTSTGIVTIPHQVEKKKLMYTVLENQNGAVSYTVSVTDSAGNTVSQSNSTPTGYIVDTIAPTVSGNFTATRSGQPLLIGTPLLAGDVLSLVVTGSNTRNTNPLVIEANIRIGINDVNAIESPTGTFTYVVEEVDEGTVFYSASVTDLAGNIASKATTNTQFFRALHIDNSTDLIAFANRVANGDSFAEKVVILDKNIDLAGSTFGGIGSDPDNPFSGTFYGNKKIISNLTLLTSERKAFGFFGTIVGATIKDFTIANGQINGKYRVGGVVGHANNSTITGVRTGSNLLLWVTNTEDTLYENSQSHVGGIVGEAANTSIENVYNEASVTGHSFVGGIVGFAQKVDLKYAYNTGTISSIESSQKIYIGGIIGYIRSSTETGSISHVYNTGGIMAGPSANLGGIVGYLINNSSTFSNVFSAWKDYNVYLRYPGQILGWVDVSDPILALSGRQIYTRSDITIQGIGINSNNTGPYTPNTMTRNITDNTSANTLIADVFSGDDKWSGSAGSGTYPTLKYFNGW